MDNQLKNPNNQKNLILSFILVSVVIVAGYFVLNKNNGANILALNNEAMVARNDMDNSSNHNLPNPLYLKEGFTDSSNLSLNENLNNENSLQNSKLKNENSPGAFAPGDPLVRGGFKVLGGGGNYPTATVTKIADGESNFASNLILTTTGTANIGDSIIVFLFSNKNCTSASNGISSVVDSAGNSYTRDVTVFDAAGTGACVYSASVSNQLISGSSITITYTGSSGWHSLIYKLSSILPSGRLDVIGTSDTGVNTTTPSVSTDFSTTAPDVVFAGFVTSNVFSSYGAGYTGLDNNVQTVGSPNYGNTEWVQTNASAVSTASINTSSSITYIAVIVAYKITPSGLANVKFR